MWLLTSVAGAMDGSMALFSLGSDQPIECDHSSGVPAGLASGQPTPITIEHASRQASLRGIFIVVIVIGKFFQLVEHLSQLKLLINR